MHRPALALYRQRAINWQHLGVPHPRGMERLHGSWRNMFEWFYRGKAARNDKAPGTGLELAMTKEFVGKLDRRITVESEGQHGSWIIAYLR